MIEYKQISKYFGSLKAVDQLDLKILPGEVFGLLGPNGAGKTTISNLTVGLLKPDGGQIIIGNGGSPVLPQTRKVIGVAPQRLSIYEDLNAAENLAFFGKMQGLTGNNLKERVKWALDFTGLTDRRNDRVSKFSGGMQRRLNLGIALLHDPQIIILDEPTVGVDPQSRNVIFERIEELKNNSHTIIYTTHYMEEAQRLCDRVGILDHGKLLALDAIEPLISAHGGESTLIVETETEHFEKKTSDPFNDLQKVQAVTPVQNFRLERPNLETVFLNLTGRKLRD